MAEFQRICLAHYHEIGLKGHNRASFERRLLKNLEALLRDDKFPVVTIHRIAGRLCVFLKEGTDWDTARACAEVIGKVPGVARVSCGYKCPRDLGLMTEAARIAMGEAGEFETWRVAARRNHTDFPTTSMEMNQLIGGALHELFPDKTVRMKHPDLTVGVEVVQNAAYVYAFSHRGIGGLPVGSSGRLVCLLSSGIDSPVALWKVARRGATCVGVHFSGRPQTSDASEYLVDDIAHVLEETGCIARVYVVPLGDCQREIALAVPPALRVIMYRRLMFKVAERLAEREGAKALVTGESLGQVASQTLDNMVCTDDAVTMPIFRPLIGSDKLDIIDDAQRLGTFDISSQDAPDCCTLFMPRSPETHAQLADVRAAEAPLPIAQWIDELVESAEIHDYRCPSYSRKKAPR
ncbi:tRNA uracil 4-sulfurtransferase ThiI [Xiamenia xianingshaonis]|uniref:Probable tRNA sulfurtransferase n=1 Tax=Xiamenia xianingshaonis TaxID=2682776 RepID=A0A9E6SV09_9ACTN|nr:tRNA uracil 4-sulfurtransferase ThiI [Xiamenia xianingshaonis]NHM13717.1 tRNA 4-thiouridine(8) synthase ThiI [Xiamenia xianingshaonis]NHM15645.1 tRNA 4-thiouridine(8) synthase ThiI [Xiamenia xianingshaonis]QTU85086.1 tRNA 4-thiouridine(8) synthase ThiI [Xiamenia xianingshaonis]